METNLAPQKTNNGLAQGETQLQGSQRRTEGVYSPRIDILESSDAYYIYACMPGVKAEDVSLHCKEGQLVIHGRCAPRAHGRLLHHEYGVGDFYRTFELNDLVDHSKIDAKIESGLLAITLPKKEAAKPRRIAVQGK